MEDNKDLEVQVNDDSSAQVSENSLNETDNNVQTDFSQNDNNVETKFDDAGGDSENVSLSVAPERSFARVGELYTINVSNLWRELRIRVTN